MRIKQLIKTFGKYLIVAPVVALFIFFCLFFSGNVYAASDDDSVTNDGYSSVVTDLKALELYNFDYVSNNANLFITCSQQYNKESVLKTFIYLNYIGNNDDELQVYMSTTFDDSTFNNYKMSLVSYDNRTNFKKYEIDNSQLNNLSLTTRRFNITSIRLNDTDIINVEKQFYFNGSNQKNIECYTEHMETVKTEAIVHCICYGDKLDYFNIETDGIGWGRTFTDSWFAFFNIDYDIDELKSVTISYQQYDYKITSGSENNMSNLNANFTFTEDYCKDKVANPYWYYNTGITGGFKNTTDSYLTYRDPVDRKTITQGSTKVTTKNYYGWFGKYKIEYDTVDNLLNLKTYNNQDSKFCFSEFASNYNWGVHFADTERIGEHPSNAPNSTTGYIVGSGFTDFAILELRVMVSGVEKRLLAVGEVVKDFSGSSIGTDKDKSILDILKEILEFIGIIVFVVILIFISSLILPVFSVLKVIGSGIVFVIELPFKVIKKIFK